MCHTPSQVLRPDIVMDKLARSWGHKNWKVRHGLLQFVAEAVCSVGEPVLVIPKDDNSWVLHNVIKLVGDSERWVVGRCVLCVMPRPLWGNRQIQLLSAGHRHALRQVTQQSMNPYTQQWCLLSYSAVRDAAMECLEEVYKVYGEQLMDVLSAHELRPAQLNLIYNRLAQLGAHAEPTPVHSGEGKPGSGRTVPCMPLHK